MSKASFIAAALAVIAVAAEAQQKTVRLSIATGGTGGGYYPLGGGLANVLSKGLPAVEATAEGASASGDNIKLVGAGEGGLPVRPGHKDNERLHGHGKV